MTDEVTISVYDAQASAYAKRFKKAGDAHLARFMAALPNAARVLDLGCGPGQAAVQIVAAGHEVLGLDASQGMVELAREAGIEARQATFDEIPGLGPFNAVWANFSLLHAPREDFPRHIMAIARELVPGGLLHLGLKTGEGERRDTIGRLYTYFGEEEVTGHLAAAGFETPWIDHGRSAGLDGTVSDWMILHARLTDA